MFLNGGFWLARLDQFESFDVREGSLPKPNLGLLEMLLTPQQAAYTKDEYVHAARMGYASCWHMSDEDPDPQMWEGKFGNKHKGIGLRTTPGVLLNELKEFVQPGGPGYLSEVRYIDHERTTIPEGQTIDVAYCVREEYAVQREARLYVTAGGLRSFDVLPLQESVWGTKLVRRMPARQTPSKKTELRGYVPPRAESSEARFNGKTMVPRIDPFTLIEEILVGWRVNNEERKHLQELLDGTPLAKRVRYESRPTHKGDVPIQAKDKLARLHGP
jgi:hypothetical protein